MLDVRESFVGVESEESDGAGLAQVRAGTRCVWPRLRKATVYGFHYFLLFPSSPLPSPSSPPNLVFCTFITLFSISRPPLLGRAMKALFNRFNRGHSKEKVKDPRDSDSFPPPSSYQKEKLPQLPPLREWPPGPPPLEQPQHSIGTPTSITSYKPLPELSSRPLPPIEDSLVPFADYDISHSRGPLSDVAEEDSVDTTVVTRTMSPRADQDSAGRSSRKTGNGSISTTNGSHDAPKKVAFLSPPPTPSGLNTDRPLPDDASVSNKSTVVRSQPSHPKDPRGSMSTAASGSRPDIGSSKNSTQTVKVTSTRSVTSPYSAKPPYADGASIHQSLRSATPFSQKSIGSVLPPASWSEGAEEDLVTHLGPRERTRQEVLWEIVASEERYGFHPCSVSRFVNCLADMWPNC